MGRRLLNGLFSERQPGRARRSPSTERLPEHPRALPGALPPPPGRARPRRARTEDPNKARKETHKASNGISANISAENGRSPWVYASPLPGPAGPCGEDLAYLGLGSVRRKTRRQNPTQTTFKKNNTLFIPLNPRSASAFLS
ncbi:serine/arginine repetitive matrix protein 1-like isoform X1 [Corapipo altera]|uniref:serine/arginine repetitive matrix protein 1-like isoform X1 n=1 Tax=Corapipo altera TaxID=415028 RepID=UPI000FD69038|nr:serine/arginine repetitive matrix protein 1-like isoform X1 [Corapipo altera]